MKKWVETYAKDNEKFFEDFSKVIAKLFELGVPFKGILLRPRNQSLTCLDEVKPMVLKKTENAAA
jgi:hypothetical protein